jgi:hypothetical protein
VYAAQKRVIQALTQLCKVTLQWLARAASVTQLMEKTWNMLIQIKLQIAKMIDHDNDGLSIPFLNLWSFINDKLWLF